MSLLASSVLSVALIVLGAAGYLLTGRKSITALIPSFFGGALGVCSTIGLVLGAGSTLGWVVFAIVALGLLGTVRGLSGWIRGALQGNSVGAAGVCKGIMALLCASYLGWISLV